MDNNHQEHPEQQGIEPPEEESSIRHNDVIEEGNVQIQGLKSDETVLSRNKGELEGVSEENPFKILQTAKDKAEEARRECNSQTKFGKLDEGPHLRSTFDDIILALEEKGPYVLQLIESDPNILLSMRSLVSLLDSVLNFLTDSRGAYLTFSRERLSRELGVHMNGLKTLKTSLLDTIDSRIKPQIPVIEKRESEVQVDMPPLTYDTGVMNVEPEIIDNNDQSLPALLDESMTTEAAKETEDTQKEQINQEMHQGPITLSDTINSSLFDKGLQHFTGSGSINSINFNLAFRNFFEAANQGDREAMYMVSRCLEYGYGTTRNRDKAHEWLAAAACGFSTAGSLDAKNELAVSLIEESRSESGKSLGGRNEELGVPASLSGSAQLQRSFLVTDRQRVQTKRPADVALALQRAIRLLVVAAEAGHADACCNLGLVHEEAGDLQQAMSWYEKAVSQGSVRAMNFVGLLFFDGYAGPSLYFARYVKAFDVPESRFGDRALCQQIAFKLFVEAGRGGSGAACCNAGWCLEQGFGTGVSFTGALDFYKQGAHLKNARAMYNLGYLLVRQAINKPTEKSHPVQTHSTFNIQSSESKYPTSELLQEGVRWLGEAADLGIAESGYQLGRLYETGCGVPQDHNAAYALYLRAADRGYVKASLCAANMLYHGSQGSLSTKGAHLTAIFNPAGAHSDHQNNFALAVTRRAMQLYRQAAVGGSTEGMNALALILEQEASSLESELLRYVSGPEDVDSLLSMQPDEYREKAARMEEMMVEASKWYFEAAEKGLVEAACNLVLLICRSFDPMYIFRRKSPDAIVGRTGVEQQLVSWLSEAIQGGHSRSALFRNTIERLKASHLPR